LKLVPLIAKNIGGRLRKNGIAIMTNTSGIKEARSFMVAQGGES